LKPNIIGFFGILFATFTISAMDGIKNNNFNNKNKIFFGIIKL
jgi:hypothetical protein